GPPGGLVGRTGCDVRLNLCAGLGCCDKDAASRRIWNWWLSDHSAGCLGGDPLEFSEPDRRAKRTRIGDTVSAPQYRADPSGLWFGQHRCAISPHRKKARRGADAAESVDNR